MWGWTGTDIHRDLRALKPSPSPTSTQYLLDPIVYNMHQMNMIYAAGLSLKNAPNYVVLACGAMSQSNSVKTDHSQSGELE